MREIPGEIHYDSDVEYVAHLFDTLDDDNDIEDLEKEVKKILSQHERDEQRMREMCKILARALGEELS